jgi:hypothetical protein
MMNVVVLIMPRCPRCHAPVPITAKQSVQCQSCGAILEDDRIYNIKLYFAFVAIVLASGLFLPLILLVALIPICLLILVRNMRFVQKRE